jgi:hypothetical protein
LNFTISNFGGFAFATNQFNGLNIIAAADILLTNCGGAGVPGINQGCTGVVGAVGALIPTPFQVNPVPGPVVGAGLPALLAGFGFLGLRRWRRWREQRFA